jgi:hypothetical protein
MTDTGLKVLSETEILQQRVAELRRQLADAKLEIEALTTKSEWYVGSRLQSKIASQSKALTALNRRVRVQRLILREMAMEDSQRSHDLYHLVMDKYATELGEDTGLSL